MLRVIFELPEEYLIDDISERGIISLVVCEVEGEMGIGDMLFAIGSLQKCNQIFEIALM